jgi:ribosome-binding factor A
MANRRIERINEVLKREFGDILMREMVFDAQLVTVQHVDVTPDLRNAHVYVSVIGTEAQAQKVLSQLNARRPYLQFLLSRRITIKHTPTVHFKLDSGIARGTHIIHLMDELNLLPQVEPSVADAPPFPETGPVPGSPSPPKRRER